MRRRRATPRPITPDWKYNNPIVGKFINQLMWDGKKSIAEKIFYDTLDIIEKQTKRQGLEVFLQAIENIKPTMEVRPRRIGGATYQIPLNVPPRRQLFLAIKWIIQAARDKKGKPISEKLAEEIILATEKKGAAYKKKEDTHKMAEANKVFAQFRW